jgi:hypothetical protein
MPGRFNLARRPFVDTRSANLTAGILAAIVVALSFVAARTVIRYFADSSRTRASIAALRTEVASLEEARQSAEASLARVDVASLAADVEEANEIALRRAFSWTRFLSRLEKTLPSDIRISSIALQKLAAASGASPGAGGDGPREPDAHLPRPERPAEDDSRVRRLGVVRHAHAFERGPRGEGPA